MASPFDPIIYGIQHAGTKEDVKNAFDKYQETVKRYQGDEGRKYTENVASGEAAKMSGAAQSAAASSARKSGMGKAAAAALGSQSGGQAYNQQYLQSKQSELQRQQQEIAQAQAAYKDAQSKENEEWNKTYSSLGFILGTIGISDERTKEILDRWKK